MLGLLGLLAIGFVLANLAMTGYTVWMLTHPPRRTYATAVARGSPGDPGEIPPASGGPYPFESWKFESRGRSLAAWEIAGASADGPVVVFVHGWGDSRIGALSRISTFAPLASRLIAWDLPGHGDSPGTCSLGIRETEDLAALIERLGGNRPVVLVGWSLGAGICLDFAANAEARSRIVAVIAESPYRFGPTPARNVLLNARLPYRFNVPVAFACLGLEHRRGVGGYSGPRFDRAALAARVSVPVLVVHGADDRTCPPADGRLIAQAAPIGELLSVPDAGHHGLWTRPASAGIVSQATADFVARHTHRQSTMGA